MIPAARYRTFIVALVAIICIGTFMFASSAMAQQLQRIDNLGLRVPLSDVASPNRGNGPSDPLGVNRLQPNIFPQSVPGMTIIAPGLVTFPGGAITTAGLSGQRAIFDPVIAQNSIGFFNGANIQLSFSININNDIRAIQLAPRQILTIEIDRDGDIKGTIGTDEQTTTTTFARGTIYVLRANSGKWTFAKF